MLDESRPTQGAVRAALIRRAKEVLLADVKSLTFEQTCRLAKALTFENLDDDTAIDLQNHIYPRLTRASLEEVRLFCEGFICSYLVDRDLYLQMHPVVLEHAAQFEISELMRLTRAVHNLEFREEPEMLALAQERALAHIKHGWQLLSVQEYFQLFLTFHLTRHGSRELYKLLELTFTQRLEDFKEETDYLRKISSILSTSGMCDPESVLLIDNYVA